MIKIARGYTKEESERGQVNFLRNNPRCRMPNSLYGARLQGFTVVVFIVAKSRAWFDEYIYHDSLQAHAIEGIGH